MHRAAFRRVARTHMGTFDLAMVRRSELRSSAPQVHHTLGPYPQKDDAGLTEGPTKMNIFRIESEAEFIAYVDKFR